MKKKKRLSRRGVERTVLAVSSASVLLLGAMLYDNNAELNKVEKQLGEERIKIHQQKEDYKALEKELLRVKSKNEMLSQKQNELMFEIKELQNENKSIKEKLKKLEELQKKTNSSIPVKYSGWKKMTVTSTAYSTYENGDMLSGRKWGGLTKSGTAPKFGTIAVDENVIPLGKKVYIPKLNMVFVAEDTGSAIKGNRIDIFFESIEACMKWGVQKIDIYVQP